MKKQILKLIMLQLAILFAVLLVFFFVHSSFLKILPSCFWKENYNIICPSCGGTRFVISLFHGNLQEAFFYHPFFFVLLIYLFLIDIIYLLNTIIKKDLLTIFYPKWWYLLVYVCLWIAYTIYLNVM